MNATILTMFLATAPTAGAPAPQIVAEETSWSTDAERDRLNAEVDRLRTENNKLQQQTPVLVAPSVVERVTQRVAVRGIAFSAPEDERLARVVTEALTAEIRKLQRTTVISTDEIAAMLDFEAQQQLVGCESDSCISEIVEALGADALLIGEIATFGDERVFGVKLIDQRKAQTVGSVTQRLKNANGEECLAMIGPAIEELFADFPIRDGLERGVAPEIALRLNPPPLPPWVFYSGAAATGLALATVAGAGVVNGVAHANANDRIAAAKPGTPANGDALGAEVRAVQTSFTVLLVSAGAAAILGAATGVSGLFTDWDGARE